MYYECLNMYGRTKEEGFAKEQRNLIWSFKNKNIKQKKKKKNRLVFKIDPQKLGVVSKCILYFLSKIRDVPASPFLFPATTKARRLFFLPLDVVLLTLRN